MVRGPLSKSDLNSTYVLVEKVRNALVTDTNNNFWKLSHDYYNRLEVRSDKKGPSFSASCPLYHIQPPMEPDTLQEKCINLWAA